MAYQVVTKNSDYLQSAANIDLSAQNMVTFCAWVWLNGPYTSLGQFLVQHYNQTSLPGAWVVDMDAPGGISKASTFPTGSSDDCTIGHPGTGAWFHIAFQFAMWGGGPTLYDCRLNGTSVSVTNSAANHAVRAFQSGLLTLMWAPGSTQGLVGKIAQAAIFASTTAYNGSNPLLSSADFTAIVAGTPQSASVAPVNYWTLNTDGSPKVGSVALTVHGTTGTFPAEHLDSSGGTFTVTPSTIPAGHVGNITLTLTGSGTAWNNGTTVFTLPSITGLTKVSQNVTSTTAATIVCAVTSGTGTGSITDNADSGTAALTVATPTLAVSPTSGSTNTTPSITLTGTNTIWNLETASTLFTVSGGTGASIAGITVNSATSATATLTVGTATGTLTIHDASTGQTTTFTANSNASFTVTPSTIPANHSGNITLALNGTNTAWVQGTTVFTLPAVSGLTKVSQNITGSGAATIVVTTGSTTGSGNITDSTDPATAALTVATASLSVSPTSGNTSSNVNLTLTGTNTLWSSETASTLFSVSGGTGASVSSIVVISNTSATATLAVGTAAGTLTLHDASTTATASFTALASGVYQGMRIRFQFTTGSSLGYSIERLADNLFFDFADSTFKPSPTTLVHPLTEGTGSLLGRYKHDLTPLDTSQFTDGRYAINIHNTGTTGLVVGELAAMIHNGDDQPAWMDRTGYKLSSDGLSLAISAAINVRNQDAITAPTIADCLQACWDDAYGAEDNSAGDTLIKAIGATTTRTFDITLANNVAVARA